jgi:hypothetical protein
MPFGSAGSSASAAPFGIWTDISGVPLRAYGGTACLILTGSLAG